MVMDEPLDFEEEDPSSPPRAPPRAYQCLFTFRKKVIGLDDLLVDYFAVKTKHGPMGHDSDEEDKKDREDEICKIFEDCEEKAKGLDARDDKASSDLSDMGVENFQLLQSFCASEHLGFDLEIQQEFLEGMLMDGWLLKLVRIAGSVEETIASWMLTKLLYSSNKKLQDSATDFWDSILSLDENDKLPVNLGYFPSYSVLKCSSDVDPPHNIIAWLRVVSACCKIRKVCSIFSASEAEELLVIVISLFLDHGREELLIILGDCLNSLVLYFDTSEWESSCVMVAESSAMSCNKKGSDSLCHACQLGRHLALELLKINFGLKVGNVEKILKLVTYPSTDKTKVVDTWRNYLRNCSTQIACTNWGFYAPKVRNKASYLLQGAIF
ncbi:hypothetical protein PVAP13_5KG003025 [Panicum virgatum]|uniref:Uncharacterized protein n=1 Tax=Panicum virgatum TaxID=38727 RepID=A0A8T0S8V3_PANVG|nr:hypothetical protein PVAP13_5KG003025 [Panicum virgatum]